MRLQRKIQILGWVVGVSAAAAYLATLADSAPGQRLRAPAQVAPGQRCERVQAGISSMNTHTNAAFNEGDAALYFAQLYSGGTQLEDPDVARYYSHTYALDDRLTRLIIEIQTLDELWPPSPDILSQIIHTRIAEALEPIRFYQRQTGTRLTTATLCPVFDPANRCRSSAITPVYIIEGSSQPDVYDRYRDRIRNEVRLLSKFLVQQACSSI